MTNLINVTMLEESLKKQFDGMLPYIKKQFPKIISDILQRAKKIDENGFSEQNIDDIKSVLKDVKKITDIDKQIKNNLP
jgi:hypothetical protein